MDHLSPAERSRNMALMKSKDTQPELLVRRLLYSMGYRFRLHSSDLPGKPDIVFRSRRKVIFVHGCFWHRHHGCRRASTPKSNSAYWETKFSRNVARDSESIRKLAEAGWQSLVVWECELKSVESLSLKLGEFLSS